MTIHLKHILIPALLLIPVISQASDSDTAYNVHIRTLAASCAACHGTYGNTVHPYTKAPEGKATLAGIDKDHFMQQLNAFKSGQRSSTVMHHHAKGLNAEEIEQLAAFFAAQKPVAQQALNHQKLEANHE